MGKREQSAGAGSEQAVSLAFQDVVVLGIAAKEGREFLTPGQYRHVSDLVKQLVGFGRREFDSHLVYRQVGEFWELKDKGGTLGKINVRVYFKFDDKKNEIVVLSAYKKEDDGAVPKHILIRIRNRWRNYESGTIKESGYFTYRKPEKRS